MVRRGSNSRFCSRGGILRKKLLGSYGKYTCGSPSSVVALEHSRVHGRLGGEVALRSSLRARLAEIGPAITPYHSVNKSIGTAEL
jgi:hypothetical protein